MSKTLNTRIQQKYDSGTNWANVETSFVPLDGELVVYSSGTSDGPQIKVGNGSTSLKDLPFLSFAKKLTPISVPSITGTYTYNGSTQTLQWTGVTAGTVVQYGDLQAVNAGSYTAYVKPAEGYCWTDGTIDVKTYNWSIAKATPTLTLSKTSISLHDNNKTTTFTITTNSTGTLSVTSSNTSVATVSRNGTTVTVNSVNNKNGSSTITVTLAETSNYTGKTATCSVSTDFFTANSTLENNTWSVIQRGISLGVAQNYWEVGEAKKVTFSSNITLNNKTSLSSTLTKGSGVDNTNIYAVILGFNHQNTVKTADFGFPFVSIGNKYRLASFQDQYYNTSKTSTTGFSINKSYFVISAYNETYTDDNGEERDWYSNNWDATNSGVRCVLNNLITAFTDLGIPLSDMTVHTPYISIDVSSYEDEYGDYNDSTYCVSGTTSSPRKFKIPSAKELGMTYTPLDVGNRVAGWSDDLNGSTANVDPNSSTYTYFSANSPVSIGYIENNVMSSGSHDIINKIDKATYGMSYFLRDRFDVYYRDEWYEDGESKSNSTQDARIMYCCDYQDTSISIGSNKKMYYSSPNSCMGIFTIFRIA